jgi:hypothetical protein
VTLGPRNRRARTVGPLLLTTCNQSVHGPRIDGANAEDADGNRYGCLVFGAGRAAVVVGWRGTHGPAVGRIPARVPALLRPLARWLFAQRDPRPHRQEPAP